MTIARRQLVLLLIAVAVVAALIGSGATVLARVGRHGSDTDQRAILMGQIAEYDAKFGSQGPQFVADQRAFFTLHPELARYHAWYFGEDTVHVRGQFEEYSRDHTAPDLFRDPATLDRYFAYVAAHP